METRFNYINGKGKLKYGDELLDTVRNIDKNGLTLVILNNKCNLADKEGEILSDIWFDEISTFKNGISTVRLNGKYNFINKEGKLLSENWFEDVWNFNNAGVAVVKLNDKFNAIDREGKLLFDEWSHDIDDIMEMYIYGNGF